MFGKKGIPQLILFRLYQRFVGRERTIMFLGQKLISQWSAVRLPGQPVFLVGSEKFPVFPFSVEQSARWFYSEKFL